MYYLFLSPYTYASFRLGPNFCFHTHLGKPGSHDFFPLPFCARAAFFSRSPILEAVKRLCLRSHCKPLYFHGRVKYVSTELSFSSLSIHKRERLSINFFGGRKEERNIRFRIFPKKILNVKETRRFEFYFFFIKRSGGKREKRCIFSYVFFYHMSLAYTGNISNLKKKTFQPNGKSWMAFFVENLKYREKKKKTPSTKIPKQRWKKRGKNPKLG